MTLGVVMRCATVILGLLFSGCAATTAPGAIGVTRSQLMVLPSATINAQAAETFAKLSNTARGSGRLNTDDAKVRQVRGVANKLIKQVAIYRPDAAAWAWEVNVFDSPEVNAFCAPGGKIGVYTGLLVKLELTDDELAAIMGHEIAHALREHSREKASQRILASAVVQGIASSGSRYAGTSAALADVGSLLFVQLPFSRDMELEADTMGLELMARAGFDPKAAPNVWRKMQARVGGSKGDFLSTHPSHDTRVLEIEAAIPKVIALYEVAPRQPGAQATSTAVAAAGVVSSPVTTGSLITAPVPPLASTALRDGGQVVAAPRTNAQPFGQESFQIEQIARRDGCNPDASAVLTGKGPGYETYSLVCTAGNVWSVRCEFGNCRVIK